MKSFVLLSALLLTMLTTQAQQPALAPDLVLFNAAVRTMDEAHPRAEAVAIAGNRIVAVGSTAELRPLAGTKTRLIDAGQKSVLPGFNDAHVHWLMGGFSITNVNLRDAKSPEEFARRIGDSGAGVLVVAAVVWLVGAATIGNSVRSLAESSFATASNAVTRTARSVRGAASPARLGRGRPWLHH